MESGNRGIVLENELTCSVSWPPTFIPAAGGADGKDKSDLKMPARCDSSCYGFWVCYRMLMC